MSDSVIHIAICDDDGPTRARHAAFVREIGRSRGVDFGIRSYAGGAQLLFDLDDPGFAPDVVLLDILMPAPDGVATARKLRERGYIGAIVFVSRSDRYVFDAFDVGAFNYVVKQDGREAERFERVLMAAVAQMQRRNRKYILINGISEHCNIAIDSIRFFESRKHICVVHYGQGREMEFVSSLARVENALLPYRFVRIHRSFLVNCDYVERYTFRSCMLRDGTELAVGRQRYQDLRQAMQAGAAADAGEG